MKSTTGTAGSHIVTTTAGAVAGWMEGSPEGELVRFRGIPYAAAPVRARRFCPPEPVQPWTGVRPATSFGSISPQGETPLMDWLGGPQPYQDEDCLSVNVWAPNRDGSGRAVMVWIHGGGFVGGSGRLSFEDGSKLALRGDVVVVSLNYRLGALGFLSLGELDPALASSGLNGIFDQIAALEWVRDNIEAFSGDPGNVTIFGSSAGAMSVGTLLSLPAARGLFRRAIAQSGAASTALSAEAASRRTRRFLELARCSSVGDLRALEPAVVLEAQARLRDELAKEHPADRGDPGSMTPFQPVVDGHHLEDVPIALAERGDIAPVELMTGTTDAEWSFFSMAGPGPGSDEELADVFADVLDDPRVAVRIYRDRLGPHAPVKQVHDAMMTDRVFRAPMHRLADASVGAGNPTYLYRFGYRTPVMGGVLGACHSLDVPFVFDHLDGRVAAFVGTASPRSLARSMQRAWTSFARTGDPNYDGLPLWEPQRGIHRTVLRFDEPITVLDDPDPGELALWRRRDGINGKGDGINGQAGRGRAPR